MKGATWATCTTCGDRHKRTEGTTECRECRGWYDCSSCQQRYPNTDFHGVGKGRLATICAKCKALKYRRDRVVGDRMGRGPRMARFDSREQIFAAYGIEGRLLHVFNQCVPEFIKNQQMTVRKIPGRGKGGAPMTGPDMVERHGVTFSECLRVSNALCETFRTERWAELPAGCFDPERLTQTA